MNTSVAADIGFLVLAIWIYLLVGRGSFWRLAANQVPRLESKLRANVVAVIPARNEEDLIGTAIRSLLVQRDVELHVIVIDDNSTDGTRGVALSSATPDRLTVILGKPVPAEWVGKVWAMQQGIEVALQRAPDYLLLTDADIVHREDNLHQLVAVAEQQQADLTSFMVKLHCRSLPEKLLIPPFVYFFFKLYPPRGTRNPKKLTAGAAGGCMLVRPAALQRIGGMESIRAEIIDDCALARQIKRSGGRIWLGLTESAESIRPHGSLFEIGSLIARTAFNQLEHSAFLLGVAVVGLLLTYIAPVALLFSRSSTPTLLGLFATALMVLTYAPMVGYYRLDFLWSLTLPLAAIFYMGATIISALRYWFGSGGKWKGRAQDHMTSAASASNGR
jgi:hopene-associated glycosyltransferase HpnB